MHQLLLVHYLHSNDLNCDRVLSVGFVGLDSLISLAMKMFLLLVAPFAVSSLSVGEMVRAKRSGFTPEQIEKHLGLTGGNWEAEFEELCYFGFIITKTNKEGEKTVEYMWSLSPAKRHTFHFMHHVEKTVGSRVFHHLSCGSTQFEDIQGSGISSRGGASGYSFSLSHLISSQSYEDAMRLSLEKPAQLMNFEENESERSIKFEIVFAVDPSEFEKKNEGN